MAQILWTDSQGNIQLSSDAVSLATFLNSQNAELSRNIVIVDTFFGPTVDIIEFTLDERFRDRAIADLLINSDGEYASEVDNRDLSNFIEVDLASTGSAWVNAAMLSPVYDAEIVIRIIDTEFTEFL